jgi:PAS domain S-box-containing protein
MGRIQGGGLAQRRNGTSSIEEVHRFTDIFRAGTPNDVYQASLDTIEGVLGCRRVSILLVDDAGVMRFVASRGLSDATRRVFERHFPWTRDVKDPRPICIDDIAATDLPESLKEVVRTEQIGALAFIPLVASGELIGAFTTYNDAHHVFSATDIALAVTIARQLGFSLGMRRAEDALREAERQLAAELAATQQLQELSTQLIHASHDEVLYEKILDAAMAIMRSDFASMQMFYPEWGKLRLLAYRGFNPTAAAFWEWVRPASRSTCGLALTTGDRVIVPDIELSDFIAASADLETYRQTGIRAVQSTPLFSRTGSLLGMISTHWRCPHQPSENDLRLLDILARQAADLIERKQTESAYQRLAAIVDSSQDGIVSIELNSIITTWNRGAERLFGYTSDLMIGRPILMLLPSDRYHEEAQILTRIRRGESVDSYESVRKRRDGSLVDVSVSVSPMWNAAGEVIGASKVLRDISKRKKAERALAERDLQLALAGKAARVGSFAYDSSTERMHISAGYAAIHGLPDGATEIARSEWELGVHPEDRAQWEALRRRAYRERWAEYSGEYRIVRSAGEVRWIEARVFVSYDSDGRPSRAVGVDIDVTARKFADEQQHRLNAELDHRVKNALATVIAIITQSSGASGSVEDFVAALDNRIRSMASTHELLSRSRWKGVPLTELLRRELAPYASNNNTSLKGPEVILGPEAAQTTASVLHELATNAAKYGALSVRGGHVSVSWSCATNGQLLGPLAIEWLETGGPPVHPSNTGYGRKIISELVPYELGGEARLVLSSDGVHCRLYIPAKWIGQRPVNEAQP